MTSKRPYVGRTRQQISKRAKQAEIYAANRFSATTIPGSGNQWYEKGDLKDGNTTYEVKNTAKESYRLSLSVLNKLADAARQGGSLYWCLVVVFSKEKKDPVIRCVLPDSMAALFWPEGYGSLPAVYGSMTSLITAEKSQYALRLSSTEVIVVDEETAKLIIRRSKESTEECFDLGKLLTSLVNQSRQQERQLGIVGGSDLGKCTRRAWYRLNSFPPDPREASEMQVVFEIGHLIHDRVQQLLQEVFPSSRAEVVCRLPEYHFEGRADMVIRDSEALEYSIPQNRIKKMPQEIQDLIHSIAQTARKVGGILLEIKSCTTTPYSPPQAHLLQASAYAMALGVEDIVFLYINKSSGNITSYHRKNTEHVQRVTKVELKKLKQIEGQNEPPPRQSGRDCEFCRYRRQCQPERSEPRLR